MRGIGAACGIFSVVAFLACGNRDRQIFEAEAPLPAESQPKQEEACVEAFAETRREVDIIISMDQSSSMRDEIASLTENINLLPDLLAKSGLDYRVVMMAGAGRGALDVCVPPPLGGPDCGPNGNLFRPVDYHVESWDTLRLLLLTLDHPVSTLAWRGFLRPGALKVFVPITDDDSTPLTGQQFDAQLLAKAGTLFGSATSRNYIFFPVVGLKDFPSTAPCATADRPSLQYAYLAKLTDGRWFSVCRPSLKPVLEEIAKATRDRSSCEVSVPEPPADSTLDLERINVRVTPADGSPVVIPLDSTHSCAEGADGWQFSADKTKILLCGSACDLVRNDPAAKFNVGFGCNTVVR